MVGSTRCVSKRKRGTLGQLAEKAANTRRVIGRRYGIQGELVKDGGGGYKTI
jgi:hypothetical protein